MTDTKRKTIDERVEDLHVTIFIPAKEKAAIEEFFRRQLTAHEEQVRQEERERIAGKLESEAIKAWNRIMEATDAER